MSKFHLYFLPANEIYDDDDWIVHAEATDDFQILGSPNPDEASVRHDCFRATQVNSEELMPPAERWFKFLNSDEVAEKPELILVNVTVDEILNFINTHNLVSN